jgi:hypothetical protein
MADTETKAEETTASKPERVRRRVTPEIAANIREESEAVAATIHSAQLVANAAMAAAQSAVNAAVSRRDAAFRPILRSLLMDEDRATITGTEGFGADTVAIIEITPDAADAAPAKSETPHG